MRVLIIAPEVPGLPALAQNNELTRIGDHPAIQVDPLIGHLVTTDRVASRLAGTRQYDAVLVSAHGRGGHVALADSTVEANWLASQLRRAQVPLLVLAVCASAVRPDGGADLVLSFPDVVPAAGISLVAMSVSVADLAAVEYDVAFFHALANGEALTQAHRIGVEVMAARTGTAVAPQLYMAGPVPNFERLPMAPQYDDGRQPNIEATLRRMDEKLDNLTRTVYDIDARLRVVERQGEANRRPSPEIPQPWLILGAVGVVITLGLLILLTWRLL